MEYNILELPKEKHPALLKEIPDPPKKLFLVGSLPHKDNKILCVVGSRQYSDYGKNVCQTILRGLRGYPITIVSGLALGIDSIAHRVALENNIQTIAVPGSGLSPHVLYPRSHINLAHTIIEAGGGLISEFENDFEATVWSFPQRNRIMAGMSHAILVIEAETKSGTLITSRLATEYNRDVYTVPGSIFSKNSEGPHMLIRLGATPVQSAEDILLGLGIEISTPQERKYVGLSSQENFIIELLKEPKEKDDLIRESGLKTQEINMLLSAMEIKGLITESMGEIRRT